MKNKYQLAEDEFEKLDGAVDKIIYFVHDSEVIKYLHAFKDGLNAMRHQCSSETIIRVKLKKDSK